MALTISRIDRVYRDYDVTATDKDGAPAELTGVTVAALPIRTTPAAATTWTTATQVPNRYLLRRADGTLISTHTSFAAALTAWASAPAGSQIATTWTVLFVGPDADDTDALVVPSGGADLWIKVADTPEIDAERVERISVS